MCLTQWKHNCDLTLYGNTKGKQVPRQVMARQWKTKCGNLIWLRPLSDAILMIVSTEPFFMLYGLYVQHKQALKLQRRMFSRARCKADRICHHAAIDSCTADGKSAWMWVSQWQRVFCTDTQSDFPPHKPAGVKNLSNEHSFYTSPAFCRICASGFELNGQHWFASETKKKATDFPVGSVRTIFTFYSAFS